MHRRLVVALLLVAGGAVGAAARPRAGAQAGRPAAQLLLARAVPAAADDRPVVRRASCPTARRSSTAWAARCGGRRIGADEAVELTHATGATTTSPTSRATAAASCSPATTARRSSCGGSISQAAASSALTSRWRGQCRAAAVARRQAHRLGLDAGHRPLQPVRRRHRRRRLAQRAPAARRAPEHDRPLLLFGLRPRDQPVVVAGRQAHRLRRQSRGRLGHAATSGRCAVDDPHDRRKRAAARKRAGARARNSRPTASASLFASYHGRQWHQLWLTTLAGRRAAAADVRRIRPRATRAGRPTASASPTSATRHGNTSLVVLDVVGGARRAPWSSEARATLSPTGAPDARHPRRPGHSGAGARGGARQRRTRARAATAPGCTPTTASTARCSAAETHYFHCASPLHARRAGRRHRRSACSTASPTAPVAADASTLAAGPSRDRSPSTLQSQRPAGGVRQLASAPTCTCT